jgi:hypothetical protein
VIPKIFLLDIPLGHINFTDFIDLVVQRDLRPEWPDDKDAPMLSLFGKLLKIAGQKTLKIGRLLLHYVIGSLVYLTQPPCGLPNTSTCTQTPKIA